MSNNKESERSEKYEQMMFGGVASQERRQAALNRAHEIRKFEIDLYWKRTLYFWGFEIVILGVLAVLFAADNFKEHYYLAATLLALMGLFITIAWFYVTKGSKAWQQNWEKHIDFLEAPYEGNLYRVVIGKKSEFYSVSRINQWVIRGWVIFWIITLIYILFCIQVLLGLLGLGLLVTVFLILYESKLLLCKEVCKKIYRTILQSKVKKRTYLRRICLILIKKWKTAFDRDDNHDNQHIHLRSKTFK